MRIGLNLLYLLPGHVGGTESYAAGMVQGFAALPHEHDMVVFVNEESRDWPLPDDSRIARVVCPVRAQSRSRRYLYEQTRLAALARRKRVDILHSLGYVGPVATSMPTVVTVHDLNMYAFGHLMPFARRLALQTLVGASVRFSSTVVTDSESSRRELTARFPSVRKKIEVIPAAPRTRLTAATAATAAEFPRSAFSGNSTQLPPSASPRNSYFLAFSSTYPNKNLPRLLEAWSRAHAALPAHWQLKLVGHRPEGFDSLRGDNVHWLGYQTDENVVSLLRGARALLFPSYYEGFGLPILEAQQVGVPVGAGNRSSVPEVAGKGALLFDPFDAREITLAIVRLALDDTLCAELSEAGRANVLKYNWTTSAAMLLTLYEQLHGEARVPAGEARVPAGEASSRAGYETPYRTLSQRSFETPYERTYR